MLITNQKWTFVNKLNNPLKIIEKAARVCWKSEGKICDGSDERIVKMLLNKGHDSPLEHEIISVRVITSRSVTHEIVRHRIGMSYSQESQRYVNYSGNEHIEFVRPIWWDTWSEHEQTIWTRSMKNAESEYNALIRHGSRPEQAREVLPNATKTEIIITGNYRAWLHFFDLRCSKQAHPQIRQLARSMLTGFYNVIPVVFDELLEKYTETNT